METSILIIDDEKKLSNLLSRILSLEGLKIFQACTGKEGLKIVKTESIQVVICDVKLPDINGIELITQIKSLKSHIEIISLTAFGNIADGVKAIKNGAFDYLVKGDDNDRIIPLVHQALHKVSIQLKVSELNTESSKFRGFEEILGQSKAINEAINLARKVSITDTTVLLLGETGTGKEVFAQAIHQESLRSSKPFVALNCSGFSAELLESELFGYKAGAFTGANQDKKGLLQEANGGTIFLDEIGELSLDLQAKLLRVLENQTFIKIGDTLTTKVNVRILAATNRDLQKEAEMGSFRLDLYYRLSVFSISLPPLSQRKSDIETIANFFLKHFSVKMNKHLCMHENFIQSLKSHAWKGNIRELKNVMERVVILADNDLITSDLLPIGFHNTHESGSMEMQQVEKNHIQKVLIFTKGNKAQTSRLLEIGLTTLYRKIEEYKLN